MAYPGIALVAMIGAGLGLALWYLLSDPTNEPPHISGSPPRRDPPSPTNSWGIPTGNRRRRPGSNSKARDDCPICTEPLEHLVVTVRCGHLFHASCISRWRETIQSRGRDDRNNVPCPLCRSAI